MIDTLLIARVSCQAAAVSIVAGLGAEKCEETCNQGTNRQYILSGLASG